jgi:methionine-rich copper-binding protein CopC
MQLRKGDHASDEALEQYATRSLPEAALAEIEEHLLVCSQCQQQLEEIDAFVSAMRSAARQLDQEDESRKTYWTRVSRVLTFRKFGWAMALIALVLGAVALRVSTKRPVEAFALVLETSRGSGMQHAPAGRRLELSLNTEGVASSSGYTLEVVDESGRRQYQSHVTAQQSAVRVSLAAGLRRGTYFIRLYSPARELLREYGLQID